LLVAIGVCDGKADGVAIGDAMPEGSVVGGGSCLTLFPPVALDWPAPAAIAVAITATPMVVANIPCLMGKVYRSSRYAKHEASVR
jgi:hypothetical protein